LTALSGAGLYTAIRVLHRHTKATSHKELIKKHGAAKLRAHLQQALH